MRESKMSYHRLVDCQEHSTFIYEDGINVFTISTNYPTCLNCGHAERPLELKEILDPIIVEKRKNTIAPFQLYAFRKEIL